jgi:chromosome segregation ATPase
MKGIKLSNKLILSCLEKPLGRLIKEAEDVLEEATQKKRREKRNNEHSIQVINPSFDQNRANEHLHLLERDYKHVLGLVADLKDMMRDMQSYNKRKYDRMNDEIKSLQDSVIDLKDDRKKLLGRIRDLEDDGAKYKRHRSDGSKRKASR